MILNLCECAEKKTSVSECQSGGRARDQAAAPLHQGSRPLVGTGLSYFSIISDFAICFHYIIMMKICNTMFSRLLREHKVVTLILTSTIKIFRECFILFHG